MKIVFIGAGNLATHLAKKLHNGGYKILQVYSRTMKSAKTLADRVDATYTTNISEVISNANAYIFSTKDSVLEQLIENMPQTKGVWIHTAGSISMDIFNNKVSNYGVVYPLQTFSKNRKVDWGSIPTFIEASDEDVLKVVESIAKNLSPHIFHLSSDKRLYLHASAVYACNFVNHMYEQARRLSDEVNLPFDILLPLISETCNKVHGISPKEAQTGPAVRFDENVMNKHLALIKDDESKKIYEIVSQSIHNSYKNL